MKLSSLGASISTLASRLDSRMDEIMDVIVVRLREEVPDLRAAEQPEMWGPWRESTRSNLQAAFAALQGDREPPTSPPPPAVENARLMARSGTDLSVLLRTYRVGHAVVWEFWLDELEALEFQPPSLRRSTLKLGSRFMFRYIDRVTTFVAEAYTDERDLLVRSGEQRRVQLVRELLDGSPVDARALEYELGLDHVGVIAWGKEPEASVHALAAQLDRQPFVVSVTGDTVWGWLGGTKAVADPQLRGLGRVEPAGETAVALGEPVRGPEGFRQTHRQARLAHAVALTRPAPVTRYDDVRLEALAIQDEVLAREFVARELRPLTGEDVATTRLRETLRAYFRSSQNASATAALLGIHERTVANRLRRIEERLGRGVNAHRAELETALRLYALFFGRAPTADTRPDN
jgi:hypothetical protein